MNVHVMMENAIKDERVDRKRKQKAMKQHGDEYLRIANGLIVIQEYVIRFWFDVGSLDIAVAGDHHVLNGMWGSLRKLGYDCIDRPTEEKVPSWCAWWHHKEDEELYPRLWVTFTSTKCTRKKIGTEIVEQAVYETVCE